MPTTGRRRIARGLLRRVDVRELACVIQVLIELEVLDESRRVIQVLG